MPTPIELALSSLLPTVAYLPPDLVSLASSLLSQSRGKAASLKPEEEIGRSYACAHIACNRLQKRLDLEIGKPAPPVKPRVYDKLYRYLDGALTTTVPRTPTANRVKDAVGNVSGSEKSGARGAQTASKTQEAKTPTTSGRKRTREETEDKQDSAVPAFVMPMIRAICKANGVASAAPHVLVGATSVVQEIVSRARRRSSIDPPSKRRRKTPQSAKSDISTNSATAPIESIAMSRWPALAIALLLFTAAKMNGIEVEDPRIEAMQKKATDAAKAHHKSNKDSLPDELDEGMKKLDSNIKFYKLEADDSGWLDMDWYQNVPQVQIDESDIEGSDADEGDEFAERAKNRPNKTPLQRKEKHRGKAGDSLEDTVGAAGLLPGLGTMFQPAIDWLSEDNKWDFAQWKRGMLEEIQTIENRA